MDMKLRVSRHIYDRRLARMAELIRMKAPAVIIYHEARLIQEAYRPNLWDRIQWALLRSRVGMLVNLWTDPEWWRFKLTGVSEIYNPTADDPDFGQEAEAHRDWFMPSMYHLLEEIAAPLLADVLPSFATELQQLLTEKGESELAAQVPGLMIFDRCRCGDDFCSTFYTQPKPDGAYGPGHRNVVLAPDNGTLILDVVAEEIACIELLDRNDVRKKLLAVLP